MVDVAALHMWNQKYGPQVSLDCNDKTFIYYGHVGMTIVSSLVLTASTEGDSRSFFSGSWSSSSSVLYSSMVSPLEKWMILRGTFSLCGCCGSSFPSRSPSSTLSKSFPGLEPPAWGEIGSKTRTFVLTARQTNRRTDFYCSTMTTAATSDNN